MTTQDLLLGDITKLKIDLDNVGMKLPPGLAGMYGEISAWKELEKRYHKKGFEVRFGSGASKADIVLVKNNEKINIEVKTSRLKDEGFGTGYGFAVNIKKCKNHKIAFEHPKKGKIYGDFCYFDFVLVITLSDNLEPTFYIFPNEFIKKHEKTLRNRSTRFSSHTHRLLFIEKEKELNEVTNFDRKMKKLKNKFKNAWYLIK